MQESELGKVYRPGEVIVAEGEVGDCMYVIQQGRVEVVKDAGGEDELRLDEIPAGSFFGEMALFEREVRSATVRALEESRVLTVDKRTLLRRVQEDPLLAVNLVKAMSARIRHLHALLREEQAVRPRIRPPGEGDG